MLNKLFRKSTDAAPELVTSNLYDDKTFYPAFNKDLNNCGSELIIESPFITRRRVQYLLPALQKLKDRKVRIIINTKDPHELDEERRDEAYRTKASRQHNGIQVIYYGFAGHRSNLISTLGVN